MSVLFRYSISVVESAGGADFSFPYVSDRELVPNDVVEDRLGRVFVVLSVSETTPDPVDDDVRLGSANARPA